MNELTNDGFDTFGAPWSRYGRSLYFTSAGTGRAEVWKMPATAGTAVQVSRDGGQFAMESVDGKTLYIARILRGDSGSIWQMPSAGGAEEQLAESVPRQLSCRQARDRATPGTNPPRAWKEPLTLFSWHRTYCSFANSAFACCRIGTSGSASFQVVRKS